MTVVNRALLLLVLLVSLVAAGRSQEPVWEVEAPFRWELGARPELHLLLPGDTTGARLGLLPAVEGLRLVPYPTRASEEGARWGLRLEARSAGRFELPSFEVHAGGQILQTPPLALLCTAPPEHPRVRLRLAPPRRPLFVGEVWRARLRVEMDPRFREENLVALSRGRLDLPVDLRTPWSFLPPEVELLPEQRPEPGVRAGIDGDLEGVLREGAPTSEGNLNYIHERWLRVREAGTVTIPPARLRFAMATRFEDDFVARRPLDRSVHRIVSPSVRLELRELPRESRPPGFTGAIGRFEVHAEVADATPRGWSLRLEWQAPAGETLPLRTLRIPSLPGLRPLVARRGEGDAAGRFLYDFGPPSPPAYVPALSFPVFDPAPPGQYREVRTAPIGTPPAPAETETPAAPSPVEPEGKRERGPQAVAVLVGLLLLASSVAWWALRRRRSTADEDGTRLDAAGERLDTALAGGDIEAVHDALVEWLALRTGRPAPRLLGDGVREALVHAGCPDAVVARVEGLLDSLQSARYAAGGTSPGLSEEASAAVQALRDVEWRAG